MFAESDDLDPYDADALEAHQFDTHLTKLLRDYDDARAALHGLRETTDRTTRWMILDRAVQTAQALELERTRGTYQPDLAPLMRGVA